MIIFFAAEIRNTTGLPQFSEHHHVSIFPLRLQHKQLKVLGSGRESHGRNLKPQFHQHTSQVGVVLHKAQVQYSFKFNISEISDCFVYRAKMKSVNIQTSLQASNTSPTALLFKSLFFSFFFFGTDGTAENTQKSRAQTFRSSTTTSKIFHNKFMGAGQGVGTPNKSESESEQSLLPSLSSHKRNLLW